MKRLLMYSVAAFMLSMSVFMGASAFAGTQATDCVPKDAYDETVTVTEAYDENVVDAPAVDQWWHWNGGNTDTAPSAPPSDGWNTDKGEHNGLENKPDYAPNTVFDASNDHSANADWFYHEVVSEQSHTVHHDAVTQTVHHDTVTCDSGTPTPTPDPTLGPAPTFEPGPTDTVKPKPVIPTVVHAGMEGLPNTGGPNWWLFGAGAVLFAVGVGLTVLGKRLKK